MISNFTFKINPLGKNVSPNRHKVLEELGNAASVEKMWCFWLQPFFRLKVEDREPEAGKGQIFLLNSLLIVVTLYYIVVELSSKDDLLLWSGGLGCQPGQWFCFSLHRCCLACIVFLFQISSSWCFIGLSIPSQFRCNSFYISMSLPGLLDFLNIFMISDRQQLVHPSKDFYWHFLCHAPPNCSLYLTQI